MITRIVSMQFKEEFVEDFLKIFEDRKHKIQSFEGCKQVNMFQNIHDSSNCYTISIWESEDHLNQYRQSEMFKETWTLVKSMFSDRASAYSLEKKA